MSSFIKDWQARNGLSADGVIGKMTLNKLQCVLGIPTAQATAHFIATCDHESAGFTRFVENMNYSAQGLAATWPSRYADKGRPNALALQLARNPVAIANHTYANRMGNGSVGSGDGHRFRGRGAVQLTGRENYQAFSNYMDNPNIMSNPDLVATRYQLESAKFFFERNGLWGMAAVVNDQAIEQLRRRVNGGRIGLDEVRRLTYHYWRLITT